MALEFLIPMVVSVAFFATIGYIVRVIVDGRRRRERMQVLTEFHRRLIDKIGSAHDFSQFLDSAGGGRFLDSISVERTAVTAPHERLLRAVQTGIVSSVLGIGLLQLGAWYRFDDEGFTILGVIALSLGVGFLLSALASYRIAKSFGLLESTGPAIPQGEPG